MRALPRLASVFLGVTALAFCWLALQLTRSGHPWGSYQVLVSAALAAVSAGGTLLSPRARVRVASFGVSIALSLYLVEFAVYSLGERSRADERPWCGREPCDRRSVRAVLHDLEATDHRKAYPIVNPIRQGIFTGRLTPLGGIANVPTVFCHDETSWITYNSDEHGFRNPFGSWARGRPPLLAVGDSFTHGMCVGNPFVETIRGRHAGAVNLGMMGAGPLTELAILKEYASVLQPAVVLWLYYEGNDIADLTMENRTVLPNYLHREFSQGLYQRQDDVDTLLRTYYDSRLSSVGIFNRNRLKLSSTRVFLFDHFASLRSVARTEDLTDRRQSETMFVGNQASAEADEFVEVLREARRVVQSWDGRLVFVYLPAVYRFRDRDYDPGGESHALVLDAASRLDIPVIDLVPAFQQAPDPNRLFSLSNQGHYTPEGNARVAEHILADLPAVAGAR